MRPWRVVVGVTMTAGALAVWALWAELWYLRPFWQFLVADYGWYIAAHAGLAVMAFAAGVYVAARSVSFGRGSAARWMWSSGRFAGARGRIGVGGGAGAGRGGKLQRMTSVPPQVRREKAQTLSPHPLICSNLFSS